MALVDQIISAESGGNPNARNSKSSASGLGQFIDGTWLSMLRKHRPDLVAGKSTGELLALKSDPQLSREMTSAYAADNAGILTKHGLPVTPGSTYLAHFAGPQGAVGILKADPSMPVAGILTPAAVKANPFLNGMTAADLRAWADRKVGGKSVGTIPHHAAPRTMPGATVAPPGILGVPEEEKKTDADTGLAGLLGAIPSAPKAPQIQFAPMSRGQASFPGLPQYLAQYMKSINGGIA